VDRKTDARDRIHYHAVRAGGNSRHKLLEVGSIIVSVAVVDVVFEDVADRSSSLFDDNSTDFDEPTTDHVRNTVCQSTSVGVMCSDNLFWLQAHYQTNKTRSWS